MQRMAFSLTVVLVLLTSSAAGVLSASVDNWSMFHHDAQHTGYSPSKAPKTPNMMWNASVGPFVSSSPAFGKGRLYIGSTDGKMYFFDADPSEGTDEGIIDPPGSTSDLIMNFSAGGPIYSSPVWDDGRLYFGSSDGKVYCVYSSVGTEIWNYSTSGPVSSSPTVVNGKVYVGSEDGTIYALDAITGENLWVRPTSGPIRSSPAVVDGKVYVGSDDNKVYCLYASNGTEYWTYSTNDRVVSSPAVADGKIYVGSEDGNVYCLYASNGTENWRFSTLGAVCSSPAIADGKVFVGSDYGYLYCIYASNGSLYNQYAADDMVRSSPVVAENKVYVGSNDGYVYCFNITDGQRLWCYDTHAPISSSPAIINMRLYVASENGNIYCFRDENPPDVPLIPNGPTVGIIKEEYRFISRTSDPESDPIFYLFDWGDGNKSGWLGPFDQQVVVNATYIWKTEGEYQVRVKAKDSFGVESDWSLPITLEINILTISLLRGGFGIHLEISNIGKRKVWYIAWNVTYVGGRVMNPAYGKFSGEIESIPSGESQMITTGPFFEYGRLKVIIKIQDKYQENIMTKTVNAYAFGYLVFILPW
ncbi:MAG: PQQ-binding-like beta-propeller repeat protein [Euryarchaeota archaeon]|nr:PQQ-binding-like beta-propeller repeat protein [Euryarchaeota archaeon]